MKYYLSILIILVFCDKSFPQNWSTYCGGGSNDYGIGVCSNTYRDVVATGVTKSANFPVTAGAFQTSYAGDSDVFIIKFNSLGQRQWSTYYGGSGGDEGRNIALDNDGNIYVVGTTISVNFPVSPGAQQPNNAGSFDAFILKFNGSGQRIWATYLGGSNDDEGLAVSTDDHGNVFITGYTMSTNFPVTTGAFQVTNSGGYDAFIVKLNAEGRRVWSTYYGGSLSDGADELALSDINGKLAITGYTASTNFPVTSGCFQSFLAGNTDAFIVSFDTSGIRRWATYYGGNGYEYGYGGISFDNNNNVLASGWTNSIYLPVTVNAFQMTNAGGFDAYLLKFDSLGIRKIATYCGGSADDKGEGISSDSLGNIYITGFTNSANFPVVPGALQFQNAGGYDAFIMKFNSLGQRIAGTYFGGTLDDFCYDFSLMFNGTVLLGGKTLSSDYPVSSNCFQNYNAGYNDGFITLINGSLIGINISGQNLPFEYSLSQNYPNPFNPVTRIKFDIPTPLNPPFAKGGTAKPGGFVKLAIYDILGREIAVLVNDQLSPGTYEVTWDASAYPSGVYFYKLFAGSYFETKKMVLVK